jgi:hypothetical protein
MRFRFQHLREFAGTLLAILLIAGVPIPSYAQSVGTVEQVVGSVKAERGGSSHALTAGAEIQVQDRITTADASKVQIVFNDGSSVAAGPNTSFDVAEYDPSGSRTGALSLLIGIIRTNLSDIWESGFSVQARAAVASVRSTHWITIAEPERSSVFVISGEVAVRASATDQEAVLAKGDGIDVPIGGGLPSVKQWGIYRIGTSMARTLLP